MYALSTSQNVPVYFRMACLLKSLKFCTCTFAQWKTYLKIFVNSTELVFSWFRITSVSCSQRNSAFPQVTSCAFVFFLSHTKPDIEHRSSIPFIFMPPSNYSHRHFCIRQTTINKMKMRKMGSEHQKFFGQEGISGALEMCYFLSQWWSLDVFLLKKKKYSYDFFTSVFMF